MPGRLGPRFAIEALFLIALAVGAGFADLATRWIVVVMAGGWLVVALLELTADRIWAAAPPWRRPYYVPISPPRPEPAPPPPAPEVPEPEPEAATVIVPAIEPTAAVAVEPAPETEHEPEPVAEKPAAPRLERLEPRPKRGWFRRRDREDAAEELAEPDPPKHVRLLPTSEPGSRVSEEVAEIFDEPEREGRGRR
jgi:hypothetical protein